MESWIHSCEYAKLETDNDGVVTIEGGIDEFERIGNKNQDEEEGEEEVHVYLLSKRTELFEIEMRWNFRPEEVIDEDDETISNIAENHLETYANHAAATYLQHMDLPPIQGIFSDGFSVTLSTEIETDDFSD